jgi:hypothetical protein
VAWAGREAALGPPGACTVRAGWVDGYVLTEGIAALMFVQARALRGRTPPRGEGHHAPFIPGLLEQRIFELDVPMNPLRGLLLVTLMGIAPVALAYESPQFVVVASMDGYEVRDYAPFLVAETAVDGASERGRNAAFRRLFRYISGGNAGERKIEMTVPVIQQPRRGERIEMTVPVTTETRAGGEVMQFMLPRAYDMATAPLPSDPGVQLREVPGERLAVRRYSGRSTEARFARERDALLAQLAAERMPVSGPARFAVYNGPLTPWFARRNEVMVPLDATAPPAPE